MYWHPYNFELDKESFLHSLQNLSLLPFSHYQNNAIFQAMTQLYRNVFFFLPAGVIAAVMLKGDRHFSSVGRILIKSVLFLLITGFAGVMELGQFFLPSRIPDLTDVLLGMLGAWAGYWLTRQFSNSHKEEIHEPLSSSDQPV